MSAKCTKCLTENTADSKFCRECAAPLTAHAAPEISVTRTIETNVEELARGTTFAGRYEIVEELGAGGMGRVYRAYDKKLQEDIALKLIRPDIGADRKTIERFHNEIKIARKITHKNVCRTHDLHEERKTLFLTMEFVRGEDLRSLIHRTKVLSIATSVSIARQIAEGLSEAHKLGIIHRDLKPGNIMIDKDGQAKIMDFGIARSLLGKGLTGEGAIVGTPEYMSPEQIEGKEIDQRSDIYSLGIILYEMLIGRPPFEGETPFSVATKHKTEPPPVPKKIIPQMPEELNRLILRCLEKDKTKRYQTAEELVADLSAIEQTLPSTDRALSRARTKVRTSREITVKLTPRKIIIPAAVILFLAIAIVTALILFKPAHGKIEKIAVLPLKDRSVKKGEGYSIDGIHEALINELRKIPSVLTIGPRNVQRFKDMKETYAAIARILKVDALVEASVTQMGNRIKIDVSLYDGRTERPIGAPITFEKNDSEILALYGEVALKIARSIDAKLTIQNIEQLSRKLKVIPKAYELYQEAHHSMGMNNKLSIQEYMNKRLDLFRQSVTIDPNFAPGHAWIAYTYRDMATLGMMPQGEAFAKAKESALKAIQLDESLTEAHDVLGLILFESEWDAAGAEIEYRRVMELGPLATGNAPVSIFLYFTLTGRFDEALALQKRYAEMNPLEPVSMAWILYMAGRFDEAIADATQFLDLFPERWDVRGVRSNSYALKKMCLESLVDGEKILAGAPSVASNPNLLIGLACNCACCGKREKAEELIETLKKTGYVGEDPACLSVIYAQLGEKRLALDALKKGFEIHNASMPTWKGDPMLSPIRDDPEFKALMKKYGFEK